ncbi:MAG: hypothetical protein HY828_03595 [Actinobacteria bacterium]|nr:hypothetical protein [Actinomycetota bacterium]
MFIAFGAATSTPGDSQPNPQPSASSGSYDHAQIQVDINMTQAMSTPSAAGPMQNGQIADSQLQRSSDPGYVQALGQHQADINRMIGIAP